MSLFVPGPCDEMRVSTFYHQSYWYCWWFLLNFLESKSLYFDSILKKVCSERYHCIHVTIGSGNSLAPNKWQAITWISGGQDCVTWPQWVKQKYLGFCLNYLNNSIWWQASLMKTYLSPSLNTLRLRQNGHHFADNILKIIFSNKNSVFFFNWNFTEISSWGFNWQISSLVQIMAWCWIGDKPLSEPIMGLFINNIRSLRELSTGSFFLLH